jgi:acetyltransferase-like isoleucine patch superfamily enzyme
MSQLRKHLKFTTQNKWRAWRERKRLGRLGQKVWIDKRVEFMRFPENISLEDEVVVKEGARICACNEKAKVTIGARTTVGYHTFLFASAGINIGSDCLIAPFVYVVDSDHQIEKGKKINTQPNITAPITIGNDVWIASNVTILKGVSIGDGAVVAANSVVNKNVGANEIWGGSPAKQIGTRD